MSDAAQVQTREPFRPTAPPRPEKWLPSWTLFFGDYPRDVLARWPRSTFETLYEFAPSLGMRYHIVSDPAAIRHILLDNAANYHRPTLVRRILRSLMGDSLFNSEGEPWREQRRMMAPVFTPAAIAHFVPSFRAAAARAADRWASAGGRIDASAEATRTTFEIITEALFSNAPIMAYDEAAEHVTAALQATGAMTFANLFGMPWLDRSKAANRGRAGGRFILEQFTRFIENRQADPFPPQDFITRLLDAFAETHGPKEAAQLAFDNAITFFGAGHETTASGLAWTLYLLSQDQAVQDRARAEVEAALTDDPSPDLLLTRLTYLRQVWEEALRLYPPAPRVDRQAIGDDEICGHKVRKGDWMLMPTWVMHRHKRLWPNPDLFDPENFSPQAKKGHDRFQYMPFGAGQRICIGMAFANAEALLILVEWLSRYRFSPEPGHAVIAASAVTVRPVGGLPLRIEAVY